MDLEFPKGSFISCFLRWPCNAMFSDAYLVPGLVLDTGDLNLVLAAHELSLHSREGLQGQNNTGAIRDLQRR